MNTQNIAVWALCGTLLVSLSACELRRDGDATPEPIEADAPDETTQLSEPEHVEEEPAPSFSIIREEEPAEPEVAATQPFSTTIPFGEGGNNIDAASMLLLEDALDSPALGEGWPVTLRGHSDSAGNDSANLRASRARAEAVAAWLVEKGVDDSRITVIAFGEQNPIAPNALPDGSPNEEGRALNRRVDLEIAPVAQDSENIASIDEDA